MALTEIDCPACEGTGIEWCREPGAERLYQGWREEPCLRCMGAGVIERQYGPQDPYDEVSNRPRAGSNWAIFARWEQEREQQG